MHHAFQRSWRRIHAVRACATKHALIALVGGLLLTSASAPVAAGEVKLPWEEYDKLVKRRTTISALGPELFGDRVDFYTTSLSFSQTDISLPGNHNLPVALTRTFTVSNKSLAYRNDMPMADWDLDLPRLSGVFATTWHDSRCSGSAAPPFVSVPGGNGYNANEYWHGNQAQMPAGGEMLQANKGAQQPTTGGPFPWMTPGFTYFSCLSSIGNGSGEGFLGIAPDGTKYWFNWMAQYYESPLDKPVSGSPDMAGQLTRKRNVLYATRVEDRFGNWVTYSFSNSATAPARLSSIQSSDGRQIALTYNAQGQVATASDGSHTWTYQYSYPSTGKGTLTGVVLPDTRSWAINFKPLSDAEFEYDPDGARNCDTTAFVLGGGGTGTITHPSGAVGEFEVGITYQGRSNVPKACINWETPTNNPNNDIATWPRRFDVMGLKRKRITGPGLDPMEWTYSSGSQGSWAAGTGPTCQTTDCDKPVCLSDDCAGTSTTIVSGPNSEWNRYTFGTSYRYNEGKLLKVERGTSATNILSTQTITYELAQSGQSFPTPIGTSPQSRGDGFIAEYLRPQRSKTIVQDGNTFSSVVNSFDGFARPLSVTATGNASRTDVTAYADNLSKWVLGQIATVTNTNTTPNVLASKTDYDGNAMPWKIYGAGTTASPGPLLQTLTYNTTAAVDTGQRGTVATVKDGRGYVTTLSNWKRGIPQTIQHPATPEAPGGATESATVNDDGTLASVVDENGYKSCYTYDAMRRLASITQPSETTAGACDTSAWAATTQAFAPVASSEYGIAAGHWKQTISTGNGRKVTYFDALWRPLVDEAYDTASPSTTRSVTVTRYDTSGRPAFRSYPRASITSYADTALQGTVTAYDALGRVIRVDQHSELGTLTSTTEYLTGYQRRVTNPRGIATIESFQMFDAPRYEAPLQIDAAVGSAETTRTVITRDLFGKPLDVSKGPGG